MRGTPWTEREQKILEDNLENRTIQEVARMLERPYTTVFQNAKKLRAENPGKYENKRKRKTVDLKECPDCGSSKINEVESMCQGAKYFCINCFREYNRYGELVQPIL